MCHLMISSSWLSKAPCCLCKGMPLPFTSVPCHLGPLSLCPHPPVTQSPWNIHGHCFSNPSCGSPLHTTQLQRNYKVEICILFCSFIGARGHIFFARPCVPQSPTEYLPCSKCRNNICCLVHWDSVLLASLLTTVPWPQILIPVTPYQSLCHQHDQPKCESHSREQGCSALCSLLAVHLLPDLLTSHTSEPCPSILLCLLMIFFLLIYLLQHGWGYDLLSLPFWFLK